MKKLNEAIRDDSGLALVVVVMAATVLFLLATTVLAYASYRQSSNNHLVDRNQAMYLADAGINEYTYQLSQNSQYAEDIGNQVLTRTVAGKGSWTVRAYPQTQDAPLTLRSVGTLTDGTTRRVTATIFPQSFADYVVLDADTGTDYSIGSDAVFGGKVRSNRNIRNDGVINGLAEAHVNCLTGSGGTPSASDATAHYPGGIKNGVAIVDFATLSTNWNDLKTYATAAGTYYGASGASGYLITMNGATVNIDKVSGPNTNIPRTGTPVVTPADPPLGHLTPTANVVTGKAIPAKGVFFFDDTVWVKGNYAANITVMTSGTMYCADNVVPTDPNATYTCGLAAATNMLFPFWYAEMPAEQTVQAATLCRDGGIGPDDGSGLTYYKKTYNNNTHVWSNWVSTTDPTPALKTRITLKGARAMKNMIGFSSGYTYRQFDMDPHLASNPPPKYPTIPGGLHVQTWREN